MAMSSAATLPRNVQQLYPGFAAILSSGGGINRPVGASGFGVKRVYPAGGTADEQPAVHDGGLAEFLAAWIAEGPFQRQFLDVGRANRGLRLIARIVEIPSPAVPLCRSDRDRLGARTTGIFFRCQGLRGV